MSATIVHRATLIPAARAAALAWLAVANATRDTYSLTQARDWACAISTRPSDIQDAVDQLQPWAWLHLCSSFGIDYSGSAS